MNKNTIIGTILLIALFMGMTYYNTPSAEQREQYRKQQELKREAARKEQERRDAEINLMSEALTQSQRDSLAAVAAFQDSVRTAVKFGPLAQATAGNEQLVTLENEVIKVSINTHGGMIEQVELKKYQNQYDSTALVLFDAQNNDMEFVFEGRGNYRDDI
ncbi:MAG: YidC/Oxa1 family insertase periplasmic-domain containing protein, partial [Bacteroidales bacterium]|nr:YidC/Oxa1 family insertase periplasmic-domain containing protein [Bacteroidales bacterium]